MFREVCTGKTAKRFALNHRAIARENDERAPLARELIASRHYGMTCASLFSLKDESQVGAGNSLARDQSLNVFANDSLNFFGLMAHYRHDPWAAGCCSLILAGYVAHLIVMIRGR